MFDIFSRQTNCICPDHQPDIHYNFSDFVEGGTPEMIRILQQRKQLLVVNNENDPVPAGITHFLVVSEETGKGKLVRKALK